MDILSWILLALVLLWIGMALRHVIQNKGGCSCGCGGKTRKTKKSCGGCESCCGCHK